MEDQGDGRKAETRVDLWSCTPKERGGIILLAIVFFIPLFFLVLCRDWCKISEFNRDGIIAFAITIGTVGISAVVFAFLVIQGVGIMTLLAKSALEKFYRKRRQEGRKEMDAEWAAWFKEKYPGQPLPPFCNGDDNHNGDTRR